MSERQPSIAQAARASRLPESRLVEIRKEAEDRGRIEQRGIRPEGAPFPIASPQTGYYEVPMLKAPQWTWAVPLYFFVGGATGSLGVIGSLADVLGGREELAARARWLALGGAGLSSILLIGDLGRPSRFLNMLRIFKPQSAMSIGSWVLSAFSTSAAASSFADLLRTRFGSALPVKLISGAGRVGSTLFGMPLHNYTGVLIGASVIPVWNNRIKSLPRDFGMSGLQSAVSVLELAGHSDSCALNGLGLLAAGVESYESADILRSHDRELKPLKRGYSGFLVQAGAVLSGPVPILLRVASMFATDKTRLRKMAAWSGVIGSLCMRYGWVQAGTVSSRDWRLPLQIDE